MKLIQVSHRFPPQRSNNVAGTLIKSHFTPAVTHNMLAIKYNIQVILFFHLYFYSTRSHFLSHFIVILIVIELKNLIKREKKIFAVIKMSASRLL